jgi:hypothetical protein
MHRMYHIMNKERPILYVSRDAEDGFWEFLCGRNDHAEKNYKLISIEEVVNIDKSINDVCDIPVGSSIERETQHDKWKT